MKERLTKKKQKHIEIPNRITIDEVSYDCDVFDRPMAIAKLGQLEDVEQELGIDLVTLFDSKYTGKMFEIELEDDKTIFFDGDSYYGHYSAEESIKVLPKIEKSYIKHFKRCVDKYNEDIDKQKVDIDIWLQKQIDKTEKAKKRIDREIRLCNEFIQDLEKQKAFYVDALDNFEPFLEREVIYIFVKDTMQDEMGIAIKLTGVENGKYWLYSEYVRDGKNNE